MHQQRVASNPLNVEPAVYITGLTLSAVNRGCKAWRVAQVRSETLFARVAALLFLSPHCPALPAILKAPCCIQPCVLGSIPYRNISCWNALVWYWCSRLCVGDARRRRLDRGLAREVQVSGCKKQVRLILAYYLQRCRHSSNRALAASSRSNCIRAVTGLLRASSCLLAHSSLRTALCCILRLWR